MDIRIELIFVPVTDTDRAKAFYVDQVGFHLDHDHRVNDALRFVQLTPPGSACSIAFGDGISDMAPGTQNSIQAVIDDADAMRDQLVRNGVAASEVQDLEWGRFVTFDDPDGNTWTFQELPQRA